MMVSTKLTNEQRLEVINRAIAECREDIEIDSTRAEAAVMKTIAYRMQEVSEDYLRLAELLEAKNKILRDMRSTNLGVRVVIIA